MNTQIGDQVHAVSTPDERIHALRGSFQLYRVREFAVALGVSKKTIDRLTEKGLPTFKLGGTRFVNIEEATAWLDTNARLRSGRPSKAARRSNGRAAAA